MDFPESLENRVIMLQRNEITEYLIYKKLSGSVKHSKNKVVLARIAKQELEHYNFWKGITGKDFPAFRFKVGLYYLLSRAFGLNFGVRLMEDAENSIKKVYLELEQESPIWREKLKKIKHEEEEHEKELVDMLDQEGLKYTGSVVLGLNDALVEITGALAGLTFAFQNAKLIAVAGSITGIAASLSMASSEYLATKEEGGKDAKKASLYTGIAYIGTVFFLILPFLIFSNPGFSLFLSLIEALIIIFFFNFYLSVSKGLPFRRKFTEMAVISLGVAVLNFLIGTFIRTYFKIDL